MATLIHAGTDKAGDLAIATPLPRIGVGILTHEQGLWR